MGKIGYYADKKIPYLSKDAADWIEIIKKSIEDGRCLYSLVEQVFSQTSNCIQFSQEPIMIIKRILDEKLIIFQVRNFLLQETCSSAGHSVLSNVYNFLYKLKNGGPNKEKEFNKIKEIFLQLFPGLDLYLDEQEIILLNRKTSQQIHQQAISATIIEIISILSHLIGFDGKIFLIELSDLHLNPRADKIMQQIITESSEKNQVICAVDTASSMRQDRSSSIALILNKKRNPGAM